jgi:uncharacterized membrane protein YedE/YeeE
MSIATATLPLSAAPAPSVDRGPLLFAALAFLAGAVLLTDLVGLRQAGLFLIGGLCGVALYHAAFGFTAGWRRFVTDRRGSGMRAQLLMVALAAVAIMPLLGLGTAFGRPLVGAIAPVGVSVLIGAALFGLGMQLGGGCGSGTLFTVGGGSARMLVTLAFFIAGAVIGTAHLPWWLEQPAWQPIALGSEFGVAGGIAVTLIGLALLALVTVWFERRRHGGLEAAKPAPRQGLDRVLHGPWPLLWGAVALAVLNIATLLVAGHPWSITYAFGLWGAKAIQAVGVPVETWTFWSWPAQARALDRSVLFDTTSVMDFGLMLGAGIAAALTGKFAPRAMLPWRSLLAAAIGGLLMGYGARLSFGCNIGALFSGIASGSVHGWLWFAAAFAGSWLGVKLRPAFRLE